MTTPIFRSDLPVVFDDASNKGDRGIAMRAWVECPDRGPPYTCVEGRNDTPDGWRKLITTMMRNRHSSPFEGGWISVYCEAPAVVWWEWTRHRFMSLGTEDHGFNLGSGRYRVLDGDFYVPSPERQCKEPPEFKAMRPILTSDEVASDMAVIGLASQCTNLWQWYESAIRHNVAREVARLVLPFNIYYAGYVSANLLTWLHFLSLRTRNPKAEIPSFPQWEIEQVAIQCEALLTECWPITLAAFNECGRRV